MLWRQPGSAAAVEDGHARGQLAHRLDVAGHLLAW